VGVPCAVPRGGENGAERGGSGFSDVDRHDSDVAAPDHSDSCGRCTPHGRGGCAANRGGRRGPVVSDGVQERLGRAGSVVVAADTRARQHSATRFGFKPIQTESKLFQMDSKFFKL
jgi:hypothetical protein